MEDCFDFDFDFFEQNQPASGDCEDADIQELARRIADTDNLVQTINSLRSENDVLKKQLLELTNSVNEVQLMYQKESFKVCELQLANDKLSSQSDTAQKDILALQGDKVQKSLYYNQLEEEWRNSLEEEKKRYKALEAKFAELQDKYQKQCKEQNDTPDTKPFPKRKSESISPSAGKKRDSNKASRMVSRGTQYQSSTTTRATCTSAFIKKQSVGVNFPEVVPIAIEDIFHEIIMDIPNLLSPIQEVVDDSCTACTQTENTAKSTVSIGTCTDLCNVRNAVDYVSEKSATNCVKRDIDWEKEMKRSHPQLSDLWELLGQTIFALIGNNGCCSAKFEDFANRIETIRSHYEGDVRLPLYYDGSRGQAFPGVNIPKKELNSSSCSSPAPVSDNPRTAQDEVNTNEPIGFERNDSHEVENLKGESDDVDFRSYEGCPKERIPDETDPPDKNDVDGVLKETCVVLSSPSDPHSDLELSAIKEEFALLDKKLLVISPIRNLPHERVSENLQIKKNLTEEINKRQGCEMSAFKTPNLNDRIAQTSTPLDQTINSMSKGGQSGTTVKSRVESRLERKRIKRRIKRRNAKLIKKMTKQISNTPTKAEDIKAAALKHSIDWQKESTETSSSLEKTDQEINNFSIEHKKILLAGTVSKTGSSLEMVRSCKRSNTGNLDEVISLSDENMTTSLNICMANTLKRSKASESEVPALEIPEISIKDNEEGMDHTSSPIKIDATSKEHLHSSSGEDCLERLLSNGARTDKFARNLFRNKSDEHTGKGNVGEPQSFLISWSDESDEELFQGFPSDEMLESDNDKILALPQDESPQSPDTFEEISADHSTVVIPLEREVEYDSDYSPASPFFKNVDPSQTPQEIPLDRIGYNENTMRSVLGHYIAKYSANNHRLCTKKSRSETVAEGKLIWLLRKIIERYLLGPADVVECKKCAKRVARRTVGKTQILITAICEIIEDTKDKITNEFTPPAPVMTKSHLNILSLVKALDRYVAGLESELLFALDQRIFNLKTDKIDLDVLINLFLLYIGIVDTQNLEVHPARLIMYKSLYYYSKMANPMIYYLLVSYPAVLPKKNDPDYDNADPLVSTLQSILNSQQYDMGKEDLKEREVFHILHLYYEYERVKPTREEVVELLLSKIRSDSFRNVNYSFALLCKRNGVNWSTQYVLSDKLVPLLNEYGDQLRDTDDHDKKVACILDCISAVLKPFPATCDINRYRNLFVNILYETDRQIVQEAAVLSILRTARFGYEQCFKLIYQWKPTYKVSDVLSLSLETFIHRSTLRKLKVLERQVQLD